MDRALLVRNQMAHFIHQLASYAHSHAVFIFFRHKCLAILSIYEFMCLLIVD